MFGKCPNRITVFSSAVADDAQTRSIPRIAANLISSSMIGARTLIGAKNHFLFGIFSSFLLRFYSSGRLVRLDGALTDECVKNRRAGQTELEITSLCTRQSVIY